RTSTTSAFSGTLSGDGASTLTKSGSGTLTLTGNNGSFASATVVAQGELKVNGHLGDVSSSSITLQAGTVLSGTGFLGEVTSIGATVSPGNSIGTVTVASLSLDPSSTVRVEI